MFKKYLFLLISLLLVFVISACGNEESKVSFDVVEDTNNNNGRYVRVVTDTTLESDFRKIVDEVKNDSSQYDAVWVYIHNKKDDPFGNLLATARLAITQKGVAMTGVPSRQEYLFELAVSSSNGTVSSNEPTEEEWQASFKESAIREAERYIELTEKSGELPVDRLESYSGVIKQQADKLTSDKDKFLKLAELVKKNKLSDVKALLEEIKEKELES